MKLTPTSLIALDTKCLLTLLPHFTSLITSSDPLFHTLKLSDLGCGTGRNTFALLPLIPPSTSVISADASPRMLEIAAAKANTRPSSSTPATRDGMPPRPNMKLVLYNILGGLALPTEIANADGLICTLVLERLPLRAFFLTFTNISPTFTPDLAVRTQAGFTGSTTGKKIRPMNWRHEISDVLSEAGKLGSKVVGDVWEREISNVDEGLGERATK
ncbi:MAG: hypothetical protein M1827_004410 [Pycnora praestabilis]|nr:MAG: hypothetical protein M1827_004410 [Pycnora praestabilis]